MASFSSNVVTGSPAQRAGTTLETTMKAIAVFPGKPDSVHLADLPMPAVDDDPETGAACWSRCCASAWTAPTARSTPPSTARRPPGTTSW